MNEENQNLQNDELEKTNEEQNKATQPEPIVSNNFEEVKVKNESQQAKQVARTDSYFDGKLLDLIGWRILAFIITVATFGIAAPWAQCMLYSYQIKHTVYNGKRLKFEGTGGDLFVNIFKWIFFSIITLGIYTFVIPVRKARWVISNIHFEDEDLVPGESYFDGHTIQLIGVNLLTSLLNLVSFGILYPFTVCYKLKWINKHTVINRKKLVFSGSSISLLGHYLLWIFLTIITFGIYGLWVPIKELKWQSKNIHIKTVGEVEKRDNSIWVALVIAILGIGLFGFIISNINVYDVKNFINTSIMKPLGLDEIEDLNVKKAKNIKNTREMIVVEKK